MPKNFGTVTDPKDIVTKEYADGIVVANPTIVGTETSLSALQIGATKYKISGGSGVSFLSVVDGKVCITYDDGTVSA